MVMSLAWGAGFAATGGVIARIPGFESDLPFPFLFAPFGVAAGLLFSPLLTRAGARATAASWGAVIGLLMSSVFVMLRKNPRELLAFAPLLTIAGAAATAVALTILRRRDVRAGDS